MANGGEGDFGNTRGDVQLAEKRTLLTNILRKNAKQARKRGLSHNEQRTERRLRKEMEVIRRQIRDHGTTSERARATSRDAWPRRVVAGIWG